MTKLIDLLKTAATCAGIADVLWMAGNGLLKIYLLILTTPQLDTITYTAQLMA